MKRVLYPPAILLALSLSAIVGCGDDEDPNATPPATSPPASLTGPQPQPTPAQPLDASVVEPSDGVIELSISGTAFVGNNIAVPVGEPVTIRVTNEDTPTHSLRIAGVDGRYDTEDDAVTEPPSIGPQGVGEVTFAPSLPGSYTFRCDFHNTMGGQITVE